MTLKTRIDVATVERVLANFTSHEQAALAFLAAHDPDAEREKLRFHSLVMWGVKSKCEYVMEFVEGDGMFGVWRVIFKDDRPVETGFDD